jgi:hypothetical protein
MQRAQLLRQLVLDSQYVVDEELVAAAILARSTARNLVSEAAFRNDLRGANDARGPQVRSFRPTKQARSFRPCDLQRARDGRALPARWHRG